MMITRAELAKRIADVSLLHGDFVLRSGQKSKFYLDKYLFETQPDVLEHLGILFAQKIHNLEKSGIRVDRIAGPELGAVALAAITSVKCRKPFIIVRNSKKDYGTSKAIEGKYQAGESVVILEDILTTGGQIIAAAKMLEAVALKVVKMFGTIDRLQGAMQAIEAAGYSCESLFTKTDLGIP
jgi:orotate phosphoribosyltransferase